MILAPVFTVFSSDVVIVSNESKAANAVVGSKVTTVVSFNKLAMRPLEYLITFFQSRNIFSILWREYEENSPFCVIYTTLLYFVINLIFNMMQKYTLVFIDSFVFK